MRTFHFAAVLPSTVVVAAAILLASVLPSCRNSAKQEAAGTSAVSSAPVNTIAVLQPGEYPLWFQLGENGPVLLETIDDARNSAALVPWPLAPHFRFALAHGDDLLFAANRDGFYRLAPLDSSANALCHYPGGSFWRAYTAAAFFRYEDSPCVLLYRDDRFLDSAAPLPAPAVWTFNAASGELAPLDIPAFNPFPAAEGWQVDALRYSGGFWHYRAVSERNEIRMFRSAALEREGEPVSLGQFQNSAKPEPLSAAPELLRSLLAFAFDSFGGGAASGSAVAQVVSPDFQQPRAFEGTGGVTLSAFFRDKTAASAAFAFAVLPDGRGQYLAENEAAPTAFALPSLPEGFVYTWVGLAGRGLFASWEEQQDYNTGAAGFMLVDIFPESGLQ